MALVTIFVGAVGVFLSSPVWSQGGCANPSPWSVSGTVSDSAGAPFQGVDIDLYDGAGNPIDLSQDFTLVDGTFEMFICEAISVGLYDLTFTPPAGSPHFPAELLGVFVAGPGITVSLVMLDPASVITGVVFDEQGIGIEEVDLDFIDSSSGVPVPFPGDVTDASGEFSVLVIPGNYDILIRETLFTSPTGPYVPILLLNRPLSVSTHLGTITLPDGIILTATVTDAVGAPLPGADLDVIDPSSGAQVVLPNMTDVTNGSGNLSVLVPAGSWELEFSPPTGSSLVAQLLEVDVVAPGPISIGTISLPEGVPVSGTTRDPNAAVVPSVDLDFIISATAVEIATADDNADLQGNFSVQVVFDTYDIQFKPIFATGLAPIEIPSVDVVGATILGDVTLPFGNALTGTVTNSGVPLEGAIVTLSTGGALAVVHGNRTDLLGAYALRQVPGFYDVTVSPPAGAGLSPVVVPGVDLSQNPVVDVDFGGPAAPPPVTSLACSASGSDALLSWQNGALDYDGIEIRRDTTLIVTLGGSATAFVDPGLASGSYDYSVRPLRGGMVAADSLCLVVIGSVTLPFIRGDSGGDGQLNIADAVAILNGLFVAGTPPSTCADAEDVNDDGQVNIADPVFLLAYLFSGGPDPFPPFPTPGPDPTADSLLCL